MTFPRSGKLLGIDHGIKRIGLATCDGLQMIARELTIITRTSKVEDFAKLNTFAAEHKVVGIVIGMPYDVDAPPGVYIQADTVKLWTERFGTTTILPIRFWDEQMTSEDAKQLARQHKRKPDAPLDDLAARIILQNYLDALRDGLTDLE
ncbi:MAG: Holliday junction resolvase RuvX [Anaerolineae bacterium]|nr:Holliday junction resolvase RuvX [Anaerolineae bacterium]